MIYRQFSEDKLSLLGLGMMRLPQKDGKIDRETVFNMVDTAIKSGINYFDTAYCYHGGESEEVTGLALSKYPRESYRVATKFPGYDLGNMPKVKEIFAEQLEKTRLGYFDYYLLHNVCESNAEAYLDEKYGIIPFLRQMKKEGKIKHLGFSCHAEYPTFVRFLKAAHEDMEFCQLQINWIDWEFQQARQKVEVLDSYGIPVWIMEPLRGGKLAAESDDVTAITGLGGLESAFRFIQSIPTVKMVLSGMSTPKQLEENIKIFGEDRPLDKKTFDALAEYGRQISLGIPCTGCRYCTEKCPVGIDIPGMIKLYNEHKFTGGGFIAPMMIASVPEGHRPSDCLGCGECQSVCPQNIKIPDIMSDFTEMLKRG